MKKTNYLIMLAAMLFSFTACNEDLLNTDQLLSVETVPTLTTVVYSTDGTTESVEVCGTETYTLWAGRTINAGTVTVSNDETNLYVTVTSFSGFQAESENIKMWLGTDLSLINGGGTSRPSAGLFPAKWKVSLSAGINSYTYTVPFNEIPFYSFANCGTQSIYVVVHADVLVPNDNGGTSGETAWGGEIFGPGSAWWYYDTYVPSCCDTPPPPPVSEKLGTAFAKGTYVFTTDRKSNPEGLPSLMLTKNRWGWAINQQNGSSTYELWVGAGLNNTSKGVLVGYVSVDFDGSQVDVTYNLSTGYSIEEAHIYASDTKPYTIAPGQYGNTYYFDPYAITFSRSFDVSDMEGDGIWLIVHAVAYGPGVVNL